MMPTINWLAILAAALVPTVIGMLFYGPLFEKQWLSSLGKTKAEMEPSNPGLTYGLAMFMAFVAALGMKMTIELVHKDLNSAGELVFGSFHTFGHGAIHGLGLALTLVVPIVVSLSLFQKNSGKNIILNVVFWIICFMLMGGILDAWN